MCCIQFPGFRGSMGAAFNNNGTAILRAPNAPRHVSVRLFDLEPAPLVLNPLPLRRTRLWELHSSLHPSILGTCITTGELRQIMGRIGFLGLDKSSGHRGIGSNRRTGGTTRDQLPIGRRLPLFVLSAVYVETRLQASTVATPAEGTVAVQISRVSQGKTIS
jgi:hypothetical protein